MLNFNFLEKDLGTVSASHFVNEFSRKILLMLYSIRPYFLKYWAICVLQLCCNYCNYVYCNYVLQSGCEVINFEINLIFLRKPFFCMTKESSQTFKYPENEKSFQSEIRSIIHHF